MDLENRMVWKQKLFPIIIYIVIGFFSSAGSENPASKAYAPTIPPQTNPFYEDITA